MPEEIKDRTMFYEDNYLEMLIDAMSINLDINRKYQIYLEEIENKAESNLRC